MSADKRGMREVLRARRRQLAAADVLRAGVAVWESLHVLPCYSDAAALIAYIPHENEVPTEYAIADSARVCRPVYLPKRGARHFVRWCPGEPLIPARGGVAEPLSGPPLGPDVPALALIPVVGWNEAGSRLGRGGGFYDRAFAAETAGIVRIGLAYEFQCCPELVPDPWDVSLHYVITERRVVHCGARISARAALFRKGGLQL